MLLCNISQVLVLVLFPKKKRFDKIYENYSEIRFWTSVQLRKKISTNEGRNIWRRATTVSKSMDQLIITFYYLSTVSKSLFVFVFLWQVCHSNKSSKTLKKVYSIFCQHQLLHLPFIRQLMIPHRWTDTIMHDWMCSNLLSTIQLWQISLLLKFHLFLFFFTCILLKIFISIIQLHRKKYVLEK